MRLSFNGKLIAAAVLVVILGIGLIVRAVAAEDPWPVDTQTAPATVVPGDGSWTDLESVDRKDPEDVAVFVAESSTQFDTVTDRTESAGILRAGDLLSDQVRAANAEPERGAGGAEWLEAAQHQAYTVAAATAEDAHYAEHAAAGVRPYVFTVRYDWQGRDGETLDGGERTVLLSLQERDGSWVVTDYYVRPVVEQEGAQKG